jgi:proteasome lid subunit RPN8/RPN11
MEADTWTNLILGWIMRAVFTWSELAVRQEEIAKLRRELITRGLRVVGLFHSHPITQATLGGRDRRNTPTGWAHLVYDVCGLQPRLYMIRRRKGRRRVEALTLSVERSRRIPIADF